MFTKNRSHLLMLEVAQRFFAEGNQREKWFMLDNHFTAVGALVQAWASRKIFSVTLSAQPLIWAGRRFMRLVRALTAHESVC